MEDGLGVVAWWLEGGEEEEEDEEGDGEATIKEEMEEE